MRRLVFEATGLIWFDYLYKHLHPASSGQDFQPEESQGSRPAGGKEALYRRFFCAFAPA